MLVKRTTRLLVFSLLGCSALAHGQIFYVDGGQGNDAAAGSKDAPFQSMARAVQEVDGKGGEIRLIPGKTPYRETLQISKGGTAENPLVVDGQGAVINLGLDITAGPWTDTGDGWRLEKVLPKGFSTGIYQATSVFVNGLGLTGDHPKGPSYAPRLWHHGYLRLDANGKLVVVFPDGLSPKNSVVVLTGKGEPMASGVALATASNVLVKNLTSAFASNDGFNLHGSGGNVFLENVKAVFNADEGISAHETYVVETKDSEVAFNGSQGGGVQDVNECTTSYKNVCSHQNRASGFALQGKSHVLDGVVSYGNGGANIPNPAENLVITNPVDKGTLPREIPVVENPASPVVPSGEVSESDQLGRFLQLRPPAE